MIDIDIDISQPAWIDDHHEEKRTEQNLFVHSNKYEAEATNNRRLHSTYCTIEANC